MVGELHKMTRAERSCKSTSEKVAQEDDSSCRRTEGRVNVGRRMQQG